MRLSRLSSRRLAILLGTWAVAGTLGLALWVLIEVRRLQHTIEAAGAVPGTGPPRAWPWFVLLYVALMVPAAVTFVGLWKRVRQLAESGTRPAD